MITTNETKKALIQKLLENKHITIDDAYMLLDEQETTRKYIPMPYVQPINNWPWVYPYQPYYGPTGPIVTWATSGTLTVGNYSDAVTDTINYTPEQWDQMHRSGQISYTVGTT